ncbi:MAG: Sugar fermentation stimulation protein A [Candidatus Heimdallarchaeota archaeon AB_125]|nr:MAG: Sugar fermentation stimulation protein A [Candidatus Heimdallarchaeota archaeon AB_125]
MELVGLFLFARFLSRPNRFLATVKLENSREIVEVHVPDPGRLEELLLSDLEVIVRQEESKNRRTRYTLVGVKTGLIWVNIESIFTNDIFRQEFHKLEKFKHLELVRSEFTFGKSRFDFLMKNKKTNKQELVEIKGATLVENQIALFPDAPTKRGARHVRELGEAVTKGWNAHVVFIIKRNDAISFKPNEKMDPKFAEELKLAQQKGVKLTAAICEYDPIITKEIAIVNEVPILIDF